MSTYWGLRDYGIPPQVWSGDPACEHAWEADVEKRQDRVAGQRAVAAPRTNGQGLEYDVSDDRARISRGAFCRCGAWRGSLGLEPTPDLYVEHMVEVFREVRRALRRDGTCWLNLGDCYISAPPGNDRPDHSGADLTRTRGLQGSSRRASRSAALVRTPGGAGSGPRIGHPAPGLKPKDLVGIPWMVAFALRADGWWLRSDIIWAKGASYCSAWSGSVMPSSVGDRPTMSHEYLFLLSRSRTYFYDEDAVRERAVSGAEAQWDPGTNGHEGGRSSAGAGKSTRRFRQPTGWNAGPGAHRTLDGRYERGPDASATATRNVRSVWCISPKPFAGAHFATFPPDLVRPCVLAGTSARGACSSCGAPWARVAGRPAQPQAYEDRKYDANPVRTLGWTPTCRCYDARYCDALPRARRARKRRQQDLADRWFGRARQRPGLAAWSTVPCTVLDPFGGSGTTGFVAKELGRRAVLVELKGEYIHDIAAPRLAQDVLPLL